MVLDFLQATTLIRDSLGDEAVADIMFAPPVESLSNDLNSLFGQAPAEPTLSTDTIVMPAVHSIPSGFTITAVVKTR